MFEEFYPHISDYVYHTCNPLSMSDVSMRDFVEKTISPAIFL